MEKVKDLKKKLQESRPEEWDVIPDIDLYMDQVISYMTRQHVGLEMDGDEENLTSAMINNYIKSGLLPRAKGKKYNREHICYLTAICLLKQVLSVSEAGVLLSNQMEHRDIRDFYNNYNKVLDEEYNKVADEISDDASDEELAQTALRLAVSSYAQKLACKKILEDITPHDEEE
jgi:hypothetical protein